MGLSWQFALASGFIIVAAVLAVLRPIVIERRKSTRKLTDTERERLASDVDGADHIRLRITRRSSDRISRARSMGILPGCQYVFVTEELLDSFSEMAIKATVAHEIAHHRHWHPGLRIVLPAVGLIGLAIIASNGPALVGVVALLPYLLLVCYVERRTEYTADESAASQVGYSAVITALSHLKRTSSDQQKSGLARLLATHPSFDDRIDHLKRLDTTENDDEESQHSD